MRTYRIAVILGDGIGPEIANEGIKVLSAVQEVTSGLDLECLRCEGGSSSYRATGNALPNETWELCKAADAIYKAPVGLTGITRPNGSDPSNDVALGLRFKLDLYANLRPIRLHPGVISPLRGKEENSINYAIVRENTEGMYVQQGGVLRDDVATDLRIVTRTGSERIARFAFEYARRKGSAPVDGRKRVTCVDKSNVLASDVFFRRIFDEVALHFEDIERDYAYADAFAQWQIRRPEHYHVIVTENMFGDILSDLGSATVGGLGVTPCANIGDEKAMFEPIHGSAPRYQGQGTANPIGMILASGMMLEWLGQNHEDRSASLAAEKIERAIDLVLKEQKVLTKDLGGKATTGQIGDRIASAIRAIS